MKFTHKLTAILAALVITLPAALTGCGSTEEDPVNYRYNYDLSEYITLGEYKGLPVTGYETGVSEEDIDRQIKATLAYYGEPLDIGENPLKKGDTVIFRCTVTLDGKEISDLYEESGMFMLGFANYGEEADEVLIGAKAGDTVYAKRTLSESTERYGEYAGKTVDYEFYVLGGHSLVMPAYTDDFVKAYLGYDTVAEYEAALYQQMEADVQDRYMTYLVSQTWPVVLENTTVIDYPAKELEESGKQRVLEAQNTAQGVGLAYAEYLSIAFNMTEAEFEEYAKELVQDRMKEDMAVYAIARAENLTVSAERFEEYLTYCVNAYDYESVDALLNAYGEKALKEGALREVVMEFVAESADVTVG